jgi:replicative DNA helicase
MDVEDFEYNFSDPSDYILEDQDVRILKGILSDNSVAREFAGTYDHSLFFGSAKDFAKKVIEYIRQYKSLPTKRVLVEKYPSESDSIEFVWDKVGEAEYNSEEFRYDLDKLKDRYANKKITSLKNHIEGLELSEEEADIDRTIRRIRSQLDDAERVRKGQRQVYTQKTLREYMPEFVEDFGRKAKNPELGQGILTGYSYLDYVTNGLLPAQMLIIGGESASGKSMLLNNMAIQMWMQKNSIYSSSEHFSKGYNIMYFSLEMPYAACFRRTMARLADLPIYGLRDSKIPADKIDQLNAAANFIRKFPNEFEIVDIPRGVTVEMIEARFNEAVSKGRVPDVVAVDYLGLMEATDIQGDDWLRLGYISGKLHEFARAYNVTVITAVQLNRPQKSVKDSADLIGMHRIGRSSLIMHHADIGIQIESRREEDTYSDLKFHIIKNRDGQLGKHTLVKKFQNATVKDFDEPYMPTEDESFSTENDTEDISIILERLGWYDKNGE